MFKKTILHQRHLSASAKMVDFCGWEMPLYYQGIIPEHLQVRHSIGMFDVSHMGIIEITGPQAEDLLDYLSTNQINNKADGSAIYTLWCNNKGGCIDDLIVYKLSKEHFFIIVNSCNRLKDLQHLQKEAVTYRVQIQERFEHHGILAIQGPEALHQLSNYFPAIAKMKPMHLIQSSYCKEPVIIATTGYTGSGGCEIFGSGVAIEQLWDRLFHDGVTPIGLGARDTLRLEMGYALYGHELSEEQPASKTVSSWTIKWSKDFYGKEALLKIQSEQSSQIGIVLTEPGIARAGYSVYQKGQIMGKITSGGFAPSLDKSVAIVQVEHALEEGQEVEVQIRQQYVKAVVKKLPFFKE